MRVCVNSIQRTCFFTTKAIFQASNEEDVDNCIFFLFSFLYFHFFFQDQEPRGSKTLLSLSRRALAFHKPLLLFFGRWAKYGDEPS